MRSNTKRVAMCQSSEITKNEFNIDIYEIPSGFFYIINTVSWNGYALLPTDGRNFINHLFDSILKLLFCFSHRRPSSSIFILTLARWIICITFRDTFRDVDNDWMLRLFIIDEQLIRRTTGTPGTRIVERNEFEQFFIYSNTRAVIWKIAWISCIPLIFKCGEGYEEVLRW